MIVLRAALAILSLLPAAVPPSFTDTVVRAARAQVGVTVGYDGSYRRLSYPGGDVPLSTGVCTDVVIRAFRAAGVDLQVEVHRDMASAFRKYPQIWGASGPDSNIDHRRVPNLATFFKRHGKTLPVSTDPAAYLPGDLVTWRLSTGVPHIGIVSDETRNGRPLMIHNIGAGTRAEDVLLAFEITGHFRYAPGIAN
jgi:uncharacterized protein YijF (DUF1287 family)